MKLFLKKLTVIFLLFVFNNIVIFFVTHYIGRKLYQFRISNVFIHYRESHLLVILVANFIIGYFIVDRIKVLREIKKQHFFVIYTFILFATLLISKFSTGASSWRSISLLSFIGSSLQELIVLAGFFLGILLRKKKKYSMITAFAVLSILVILTIKIVFPFSTQFFLFKNFNGKSDNPNQITSLELLDKNGEKINLSTSNKIIVIDFWTKNCGLCFQKFPMVKNIQKKYKTNEHVMVIAVNVYKEEKDISESEELLKETHNEDLVRYCLPKEKSKQFDIHGYPKVIVLKDGKITFEGLIEILQLFQKTYLEYAK